MFSLIELIRKKFSLVPKLLPLSVYLLILFILQNENVCMTSPFIFSTLVVIVVVFAV